MARMPDGFVFITKVSGPKVKDGKAFADVSVDNRELVMCRNCKYYEVKDHWGNFGGVPVLAASDVPTCHKWSDGCMTKPDGYCFMGERRTANETD